jgi:hypothetical protein
LRELSAALQESGVPADAIRLDDANTRRVWAARTCTIVDEMLRLP